MDYRAPAAVEVRAQRGCDVFFGFATMDDCRQVEPSGKIELPREDVFLLLAR